MKKILLFMFALVTAVTTAFAQTNLLENGDFESWTDGAPDNWGSAASAASNATLSQESTNVHGGSFAVMVSKASSNKRLACKPITLTAGTYTLSFYAYGNQVKQGYAVITDGKVADGNKDYHYTSATATTLADGEWTLVSEEITLEEETTLSIVIMRPKASTDSGLLIDDVTLTASDGGGTVDPDPVDPGTSTDISNTAETAYTVAKAHELIAAGEGLDTEVYVKGIVTSVSGFNSSYGSITYYLGDTEEDTNPIQIYGGLYYNGDMFNSIADLEEGDEIVVKGLLKSYNGTDEMDKNNVVITHKRNGEDVTPTTPSVDITNTPETAYTIAKAIELINAGEGLTTKVYVKGYIVGTPEVSTSYGNATYLISDTQGDETTTLKVFRGYYLENAKFTSEDQLAAGDQVVVYGTLTYYNNTDYEVDKGNYIYSITKAGSSTTTDISNTAETAYTVAKAHELIAAGEGLDTEVYVKGIVTSVKSFNSTYGSITYYLGDTQDDENPIQIYGGLYYNGDMFSSKDDLQVGDEIVVKGLLKSYNGTDEMDKNNVVISHKRNGEDVTPTTPTVDITNTPETAYTVAKAIELINAGESLTTKVYVKGYIVGTPEVSTSYGNATYLISDTQGDETTTLKVFRGYYLENAKFTAEDQIAVGDEVVVYGNLMLYNNENQMDSGNYIYSKNGKTTGIGNATVDNAASKAIFSIDGRKLTAPVKGVNIINGKKMLVK